MNHDAAQLVWTQCWQIAVVAIVVALINRLFCGRRPHLAYLLWLLVLVKCLTPPVWSSPIGVFSWVQLAEGRARGPSSDDHADSIAAPSTLNADLRPAAADQTAPLVVGSVEAIDAPIDGSRQFAEQPEVSAGNSMSTGKMLAIVWAVVWAVGAALLAVRMIWMAYVWRAAIRRSVVPMDPAVAATAKDLARRLRVRRSVQIKVVRQPIGPLTYGLLRPRIVLPEAIVSPRSGGDWTLVLAHELVHVRRGDTLVGLLQMAMVCLWWFHPCAWWAHRRLSVLRERSCDEEVIAEMNCSAARYARLLVDVLEQKRQPPAVAFVVGIRAFEVTKQRLEYVMRHTGSSRKKTPRLYWAVFAAALAVVAPGAASTEELQSSGQDTATANVQSSDKAKSANAEKQKATTRAGEEKSDKAAQSLIKVSDVELAEDKEKGAAVVKFNVDVPKGRRFFVAYTHEGLRGAASSNPVWETTSDGGAQVQITFSYVIEYKGDRTVSPLLSQAPYLQYRLDVKGVERGGLVSAVSPPLLSVAPDQRVMKVLDSASERDAVTANGWRRVLLFVPKAEADKEASSTTKRSEMVVGYYTDEPQNRLTEIQQLAARWSRQAHEIGSAHIKFRLARTGESRLAALSREKVNGILDEAKLNDQPQNFEAVLAKLRTMTAAEDRLSTPGEFYSIGLMSRESWGDRVHLFDGEWDMNYSAANKQISVFRAGESRVARLQVGDFRVQRGRIDYAQVEHELQPNNRLVLAAGDNKITADWTTGFVHQISRKFGDDAEDTFQFAPTRYPGGIVFPKLKIELRYSSNELWRLEFIYIDEAVFNQGVMGDTFKLAAKAGTRVIIFKPDPVAQPSFIGVDEDTEDVAGLIRQREGR